MVMGGALPRPLKGRQGGRVLDAWEEREKRREGEEERRRVREREGGREGGR